MPRIVGRTLSILLSLFFSALFIIYTNIVLAESLVPDNQQITFISKKFGTSAAKRVITWKHMLSGNQSRTITQKLVLVNRFFNTVNYMPDRTNWGLDDYWATPLELLLVNHGDSEDFAIAKYFTLCAMGVPADKLRIIYVRSTKYKRSTMVVAYYPQPTYTPFILDYFDKVVRHASDRKDLSAVFSFNGDYLWVAKENRKQQNLVGSSTRVHQWAILKNRMIKEKREFAVHH